MGLAVAALSMTHGFRTLTLELAHLLRRDPAVVQIFGRAKASVIQIQVIPNKVLQQFSASRCPPLSPGDLARGSGNADDGVSVCSWTFGVPSWKQMLVVSRGFQVVELFARGLAQVVVLPTRTSGFRPRSTSEHANPFLQSSTNRRAISACLAHFCCSHLVSVRLLDKLANRNQKRTLFAVPPNLLQCVQFTMASCKAQGLFARQFQHCGCTSRFPRGEQSPRDVC